METLKKFSCHWHGRWWGYLQNASATLLNLVGKGGRATGLLAKLIGGCPQTRLLAVPTSGPIAVLVVPALVIAAWVLLHWVWKIPLPRGMPAGLLENKPDVSSPENKVQESKDLKENQSKKGDRLNKWNLFQKIPSEYERSLFTSMLRHLPNFHLELVSFRISDSFERILYVRHCIEGFLCIDSAKRKVLLLYPR